MAQKIKLSTIADALGVSTATVSLALRGVVRLAEESETEVPEEEEVE